MLSNDAVFGAMSSALKVHGQRLELLAGNIANADTPGFKARDLDFRQLLAQQSDKPIAMAATRSGHLGGGALNSDTLVAQWRVPTQPSADGNTVETPIEQAATLDASLRYQAALRFIDGRIQSLRSAMQRG